MISAEDYKWMNAPEPVATPPVRRECGNCHHFEHDSINPEAGLGFCHGVRAGESMYPGLDKHCTGWLKS